MSGYRFPNESDEYRFRREELLALEQELRTKVELVAKMRRDLPLGGRLKTDYGFERVDVDGKVENVAFSDLFGEHESMLVYTMMYGLDWDAPCPSCTSLVDVFNASYFPLSKHCAMTVVSAAGPQQLRDWATTRRWDRIPLLSAARNSYINDYFAGEGATDPAAISMMNAFRRTPEGVFHTWASELVGHPLDNGSPRHVDMVWPLWNLLDMTPTGRGDDPIPIQDFAHTYFSKHIMGEGD